MPVRICFVVALWLIAGMLTSPAGAVIVLGGRDATGSLDGTGRNLNAAPSSLSSYVGIWGAYLGTPIGPRYFITANHIGNAGNGSFVYPNGTPIPTTYTATLAGVQNDLAIWKIADGDPAFTLWSSLYSSSTEVGNALVTIGRGTPRGTPVNTPGTMTQAGWNWGTADSAISWGANTVAAVGPVANAPAGFGGDFVSFAFNNNGNPDTGICSDGDSGGPTFVFNPTTHQYELAGINSLVDQVSTQADSSTNPQFLLRAALYDSRGFYDGPNQIAGDSPMPLSSYASDIYSALPFIDSIIVPEPGAVGILILSAPGLLVRRR
jgi:hypothetical protein